MRKKQQKRFTVSFKSYFGFARKEYKFECEVWAKEFAREIVKAGGLATIIYTDPTTSILSK